MGGETLTPEVVMDAAAPAEIRAPAVAVAVTFISRSEPADSAYPWVESGSACRPLMKGATVGLDLRGIRAMWLQLGFFAA